MSDGFGVLFSLPWAATRAAPTFSNIPEMRPYGYDTSMIGLGCEGMVIGWILGVGSVAATEGG